MNARERGRAAPCAPAGTWRRAALLAVRALRAADAGRRVWDPCDSTGLRAAVLADEGFHVTVGHGAGPPVAAAAPLFPEPPHKVDAVLLIGPSWTAGEAFRHRRLLRGLRRSLAPGGVLIAAAPLPYAPPHPGLTALDPLDGGAALPVLGGDPARGLLTVRNTAGCPDPATESTPSPVRLRAYHPCELYDLLEECGYLPLEEGDLKGYEESVAGPSLAADTADTCHPSAEDPYTWAVARATPPESPDAPGAAYAQLPSGLLDLRWTPDEADWLRPDPRTVWSEVMARGAHHLAETARSFAAEDPFGGVRAAPVLSGHFGLPVRPGQVTFGAGAASLLRDLTALADGGPVLVGRYCSPGLPGWVRGAGSALRVFDDDGDCRGWPDQLQSVRPALMVIDRPTLTGTAHPVLTLGAALEAAEQLDTLVVVNETYANYLPPSESSVRLTSRHRNVVVVRSLSKGYCQAGLRAGYAIASAALARRIREAVPALQCAELSLYVALRMLALRDPVHLLRRRAAMTRPLVARLLRASGIPSVSGHPSLPWLTGPNSPGTWRRLADRGVLAQRVPATAGPGERAAPGLLKVAVPLSDRRIHALRQAVR